MGDNSSLIEDSLLYYCREKLFRTMQIAAVEGIKRFPEDPVYKLYYCVSLIKEERSGEAEEGLSEIEDFPDVSLACRVLLAHVRNPHESFDLLLRDQLKESLASAGEMAIYVIGVVLMLMNRPDKARPFIAKVFKVSSLTKKASVLLGWIELMTNEGNPSKEVWKYFENADNSSPEAVFGRAKYYEKQNNYSKALEILNQSIVLFPKYPPAFVEKMKMHLALEDWDQALLACQRTLFLDPNNIEALRFSLIHMLSQSNNLEEVEEKLKSLYLTMMKNEPKNAELFCKTAQLLSRMSGGHKPVLEATFSMVKKAAEIKPSDPEINAEYGYQYVYLGKINKALAIFKSHACDRAVTGSIWCLIEQGDLEHANEQVKAYKQLETEFSPEMLYIFAFLSDTLSGSSDLVVDYIYDALHLYIESLKGIPWSVDFYRMLQPLLIHNISQLLALHIPNQLPKVKSKITETVKLCQSALETVHRACPGFLGFATAVMLANLKMLEGDLSTAKALLYQCLEKEESNPEGRIVMAQLYLQENNLYAASHCLEVALSFNFEVRENFDYLQVKAEIQRQQGLLTDAAETLNFAKSIAFSEPKKDFESLKKISLSKKIQLFVDLIKVYCDLNKEDAANASIIEANTLFRDSPEFDRLRFAVAYFALSFNDTDTALKILDEIKPDKSCYFEALQQKADIFLNQKKNRIKFINCYQDAVKERNTPETLNLLGDAYMRIQEPEKAIEAYERALKQNPKDSDLANKIGTALVKTHNYEKAVTYYKAAIKTGGSENLRYDLCSLLCTIKRYKDAEEMINSALESGRDVDNLNWLIMESKYLCLLEKVYSKIEREDQAVTSLQKAWSVQTRVLRKVHMEQSDADEYRKKAKGICCQLALYASKRKDYGTAVQFYREALTFDESDTEILLSLARLQIEAHDIDAARQYCGTVLSKDSENIPAAVMLADMMFEAGDLQSAKFQFQKLLDIKPDFFEAIARYIEVVRRLGKLDEAEIALKKAESASSNLSIVCDPGYHYCKGLYEWYTGNTSDALKCFNKTRSIPLWGQISLCHMIEICINPENENFSGENVDVDADLILKEKTANSQEDNIRTAEKLLLELKSKYGASLNTRIFNNLIRLAKQSKSEAEIALNDFLEILSDERYKDHAGCILGSAMAYLVLKQTPRARNQLKRIAKTAWNFSDAEYLEKAWILLGEIYIKAGKFPSATEMLDKVLLYNKSCTKAYDLYGHIAEKEQNYKDAVKNYEKAYLLTSKLNPVIGYKLAFNNMKAKRYADAIDVCQMVLNKYPNYPKIRKEILDRSRTYLRT